MTSRGNRIKICTDMRIVSLASTSPNREIHTSHSDRRGKATFYTEGIAPTYSHRKSTNLLSEHKFQSLSRNKKLSRPFTARLTASPSQDYKTSGSIVQVLH
mmetsp:Transcript_23305/g.20679  ORF Transcript_23305/g.20679 Transcript_23305/m.20679 type:complete len:101 (+) Transcript_23305:928-1230(+)